MTISVKATIRSQRIYRAEFGADLNKDLSDIYAKLHPDPFADAMKKVTIQQDQISSEEIMQQVLDNVDLTKIDGINENQLVGADETEDIMRVLWAMAKAADPNLASFESWAEDLEIMIPAKDLSAQLLQIWKDANKTTIELKN